MQSLITLATLRSRTGARISGSAPPAIKDYNIDSPADLSVRDRGGRHGRKKKADHHHHHHQLYMARYSCARAGGSVICDTPAFDAALERMHVFKSRADWLEARKTSIGGSDIGSVLGVSPYRTPWELWAKKRDGYDPITKEQQAIFDRGHALEPVTLDVYRHHTGRDTWAAGGEAQGVIRHPDHPWLMASIDGLAIEDGVVGIVDGKTAFDFYTWGDEGDVRKYDAGAERVIPPYCALQGFAYMACTGLPWIDFAVLSPPAKGEQWFGLALDVWCALGPAAVLDMMRYRTIRLWADEGIQGQMVERVAAWRQKHLIEGVEPEMSHSASAGGWLSQKYRGDPAKKVIRATAEIEDMAQILDGLQAAGRNNEREQLIAKNRLQAAMGDTYKAICDGNGVVLLSLNKRTQRRSITLKNFQR